MKHSVDIAIVGAGHNGLVAALLLARQGLNVLVLEEKQAIGGACRTETPFRTAPNLGISTGAYLLGLMPPELLKNFRYRSTDDPARSSLFRPDNRSALPTVWFRYSTDAAAVYCLFFRS